MNQTGNNFCEGVSIIVDAAVAKIKYDETIIGTITHTNVEEQNNKYRIKSNDMNFVAVAEDIYEVGDQVYVCVQQGDYSLEKRITGKYIAQEAPKNFYTEPADSLLGIVSFQATNLTDNGANAFSLSPSAFGNYNTLGLKFSLNTAEVIKPSNYKGNYNIEITFNSNPSLVITVNSNDFHNNPFVMREDLFEHQVLELTAEQIQNIYTANQYTVNITVPGEKNPFDKPTGMQLTYFAMTFGYNSSNYQIPDNITHPIALTLDAPNTGTSSDFEYTFTKNETLGEYISESKKQMSIDWNASAINDTFAIYNEDNVYPNEGDYTIYWCKYIKGYQKTEGAGDIDESGTYWKTIYAMDAHHATSYHYDFTPKREENDDSYTREQEQFKVVIKHKNGVYYTSNGITFEHTTYVAPELDIQFPNQTQVIETLGFKLTEGDDGNYNIYGSNYRVGYAELQQLNPTITAQFLDNKAEDESAWEDAVITWRIPATASMLLPPEGDEGWTKDEATNNFWEWTGRGAEAKRIKYTFANYLYPARTHNTIYCNVKITDTDDNGIQRDNYYFGSYTFTFGLKNTNGSSYALNIIPLNNEGTPYYGGFPMVTVKQEEKIIQQYSDYKAILEDETGAVTQEYDVIWSWYYDEEPTGLLLSTTETQKHQCTVSRIYLEDEEKFVELNAQTYSCAILQAKIENWEDKNGTKINLIAYYPIGFGPADCDLVGPSHIIYNYQGINPVYDGTPYNIQKTVFSTSGGDVIINIEEADSVTCEICKGIEEHETILPATIIDDITQNTLKPLPVYLIDPAPCYVQCDAVFEDNTQTTWYQPLLVTQDKYASALVNAWDTELSIDNANNTILAQTIGAGTKDIDNGYTGVLMGQVKLQETNTTQPSINYGLYGFQAGQCTFNFTDKGTAYIGNKNNYLRFDESGLNLFLGQNSTFEVGNSDDSYIKFTPETNSLIITTQQFQLYGNGISLNSFEHEYIIGNLDDNYLRFCPHDESQTFQLNISTGTLFIGNPNKSFLAFGQDDSDNITLAGDITAITAHLYDSVNFYTYYGWKRNNDGSIYYDETGYPVEEKQDEPKLCGSVDAHFANNRYSLRIISPGNVSIRASDTNFDNTFGLSGVIANHQFSIGRAGGNLFGQWGITGKWTVNESSYAAVSSAIASDRQYKHNISQLPIQYSLFFDLLQPVTYRYNNGTSNRLHTGFIAQEVGVALANANISTQDFAGLVIDNPNTENETWYLRYEEFIALNTNEIQKLKARVNELETLLREKGVML